MMKCYKITCSWFIKDKKFFVADRILAKHDENYMPPELKGIIKKDAK